MDDELEYQKVLAKRLFRSPDSAASYALGTISDPKYELGGLVFKDPQGYYTYSDPYGSGKEGQFRIRVKVPEGSKPAAIYHTHPGDHADFDAFSPADVEAAKDLKLLSYIKILKTGDIRKFEPGKSRLISGAGSRIRDMSRGEPINPHKESTE